MRKEIIEKYIYTYDELTGKAKEKAKEEMLERYHDESVFSEYCRWEYADAFPNSDLACNFSLNYSQGDGYNTTGTIDFMDFINVWETEETTKEAVKNILNFADTKDYTFTENWRHGYSCKFIDKKNAGNLSEEIIEDFIYYTTPSSEELENARKYIDLFIDSLFDYFSNYDAEQEKAGYSFFYELSEDEAQEMASCNDLEFCADGSIY